MILAVFVVSLIWLFNLQWKVSKEIVCPIYIYIAFVTLYVLFPYLYLTLGVDVVRISLRNLKMSNVEHVMLFMALTNTVIAIPLLFIGSQSRYRLMSVPAFSRPEKLLTQQFLIIYPIALLLVYLYPWAKFGEERTLGHSLASFVKIYMVLIYCSISIDVRMDCRVPIRFNFYTILMFILFIIDTARTPLFIVLLAYSYANRITFKKIITSWYKVVFVFMLFLWVTLSRTGIEFSLTLATWPIFSEAIFGSYSALNASAINLAIGTSIEMYFRFFLDQIFLIIPSGIAELFDYEYYFNRITFEANSRGFIEGSISPLGGFFIASDMILYFGYLGALVLAFYIFAYMEFTRRGKTAFHGFVYFSSFILIKSPFWAFFNLILVAGIFYLLLRTIRALLWKRGGF